MIQIQVDGKFIQAQEGELLIDVLLQNNINIPHFCYHKALGKDGNCRMCMVEIEGQKRPQIACDTPIKDGQVVRTKGEKIEQVKRSILELELINHPIDCPICDQAGECKLQDYYMDVGLYESRVDTPKQKAKKHVNLGSNVVLDQERCVLCTRCVRFTKDITKTHELGVLKRADHSVITTFPGQELNNPYAMNVVDLCPVGALTSKDFRFHKRVWFLKSDKIICNGCSMGCNIFCDHHREKYEDDMIYRYRPRVNEKVNGYFICDYGRLLYKKENEERLEANYIQGNQSDFNATIQKAKEFLKDVTKKKIFVISPSLSIEEMYMLRLVSSHFSAKLVVSTKDYFDENFNDDFLKKSDLALNKKSAEILNLTISSKDVKEIVKDFDLPIFVGLKNISSWLNQSIVLRKTCAIINPFTCKQIDKTLFAIPIASHTEKIGTFLTYGNILQKSLGEVKRQKQANSLVYICSLLGDLPCDSIDCIWDSSGLDIFNEYKKLENE